MKTAASKFFTILLTFVMIISSFGIAQVSHICTMALSGNEKIACESENNSKHACCTMPVNSNKKKAMQGDCCKDVVKYYQIKIVTILSAFLNLQNLDIAQILLFFHPVIVSGHFEIILFDRTPEFPPGGTGRQLINFQQTYLI